MWIISPDPLPTQCPAHHLPAAWSACLSPPLTDEPSSQGATEPRIATELELQRTSEQVQELATLPTTREPAMGCVSMEWSGAPCTAAEGELFIPLGLLDMERDLINWDAALEIEPPPLLSPSSLLVPSNPPLSLIPLSSPEGASVPPSLKNLPSHPLLPPPPLLSGSPSARPQPTIYAVRARWHCHTARSPWSEFHSTPPPRPRLRLGQLTRWLHHGS